MKKPQHETPAPNGQADRRFGASPGSTFVRMFKPQFAGLVLSGEKCQTVRPVPKRMPKPGDRLSLRGWTGAPYRSKQRVLRETRVEFVASIRITHEGISLNGRPLEHPFKFARADGFNTPQDMLDWFNATHGLPFEGIVIYWSNYYYATSEHIVNRPSC